MSDVFPRSVVRFRGQRVRDGLKAFSSDGCEIDVEYTDEMFFGLPVGIDVVGIAIRPDNQERYFLVNVVPVRRDQGIERA